VEGVRTTPSVCASREIGAASSLKEGAIMRKERRGGCVRGCMVYTVGADALGSPRGETSVSRVRRGEYESRTPYRRDAEGVVPYDARSGAQKRCNNLILVILRSAATKNPVPTASTRGSFAGTQDDSSQKGCSTPQIRYTAPLLYPGKERLSARTLPTD